MAETRQITFTHKEIAEALIKSSNVHEGLWGLFVEFGLKAANVTQAPGSEVLPAAIVPIVRLGIRRFEEPNNLTADAAEVNPPVPRPSRRKG